MISKRINKIQESKTFAVKAIAEAMKEKGIKLIDLGVGEPDFNVNPVIASAISDAIAEGKTRYTLSEGIPELRKAIAERYNKLYGSDYTCENVIITVGSKGAFYHLMAVLADGGDEIIIPSPYWVSYPEMAKLLDIKPVFIETDKESYFRLPLNNVEKSIGNRTRLLILNSPNNPSGAIIEADDFTSFLSLAKKKKIFILSDECYDKYIYDGSKYFSIACAEKSLRENAIIVGTFSKTFAMTGFRIGFAIGNREVIKAAAKMQTHTLSNVTTFVQWAAMTAIESEEKCFNGVLQIYERRRNLLYDGLKKIDELNLNKPAGAFYLFPNTKHLQNSLSLSSSADFSQFLLEKAHVVTIAGSAFGMEDHVRFSYAVSEDTIKQAIENIETTISENLAKK